MTVYETIREKALARVNLILGMETVYFSKSTIPNGTISVDVETQEKLDRMSEILTVLGIDHLPSPVNTSTHYPFSMYFREEDLVFAVMDKDDNDVEKAENAFVKEIEEIEKVIKRFVSYNDFVKWYFMVWSPE